MDCFVFLPVQILATAFDAEMVGLRDCVLLKFRASFGLSVE